jgi:peptidoglycan-associated lipoprotein
VLLPTEYNTLIFNSSAKVKKDQKPSKITGLPDNDFWITQKDVDGKWEKPVYIEAEINSEFDEGAATFSGDGKTMYFTRCITKSDSIESSSKVELFRAVRSGAEWSAPEKLTVHRDSTVLFAHPAISPDGSYMYFVSDLKGGYGGKDIWRCEMSGTVFGPLENLGPTINTAGDEVFPSFRDNGEFYFSSDGHPGFGGLDLFKAALFPDSGYTVENLMMPVNSSADDFSITFYGGEDRGYFSSNRKEPRGWDQLWSFEVSKPKIVVQGIVRDRYGDNISDATLRIVSDKGLNTRIRSDKDGTYRYNIEKGADYIMLGTARAYLNYSNRFYALDHDKDTTYNIDFILTPLYRPVRIDNIFFEFDKATLLPESFTALNELNKLLLDNPHIVVEIGAHTDRIGTEEYNNSLSQQRAMAVVEYLKQQGIENDRLVSKGYGKSQPVKVDSRLEQKYPFLREDTYLDEDYVGTLTPQQQEIADQINRRSEFKVLKTTYKLF